MWGSEMPHKGVLLLSGGFDSPVAGDLMARQGLDAVARRPVLRPLIGFDKQEVVDRARAIGTYEISKGPEICDLLGPSRPSTHARMDQILGEEAKLKPEHLVAMCLHGVEAEKFIGHGPARSSSSDLRGDS